MAVAREKLGNLREKPGRKVRQADLGLYYAKRGGFRRSYSTVGDALLLVGERFVERLLELQPRV